MDARRSDPASPAQPSDILLLAVCLGLLTGFGELAVLGVRKFIQDKFVFRGADVLWMAPVAYMLLFGSLAMVLWLGARLWPARVTWLIALRLFTALACFSLLYLLLHPKIHWLALILLAAGFAETGRMLAARFPDRLVHRTVRYSAPALVVIALTLGVGVRVWRAIAERWELAALPSAKASTPNVLLLILDTVRAANLSLYGYHRPTTPEIERWAATGVRFDQAIATAPWTTTSHASVFTGLHAHQVAKSWKARLAKGVPTLAESLERAGYITAGFTANPARTGSETGLNRGFLHYEDYTYRQLGLLSSTAFGRVVVDGLSIFLRIDSASRNADYINSSILRWLRRAPDRPFFIFANYLDAHEPYLSPPPFRELFGEKRSLTWSGRHPETPLTLEQAQPYIDAYDGAIAYIDSRLGALFEELSEQGLMENTIVILTADHGEAFAEHGMLYHAHSLYRYEVHVPLVISWPGHIPADRKVSAPVSLRNIPATIQDLLQLQHAPAFPGQSLARYWRDAVSLGDEAPDTVLASVRRVGKQPKWLPAGTGDLYGVQLGELWYIANAHTGHEELYDLQEDPHQRNDLTSSDSGRQVLPRLRALLTALTADTNRLGEKAPQ